MTQYKAIFFDFDGTLLPMDTDEFLHGYFKQLVGFLAAKGFEDPKGIADNVYKGTGAMMSDHPGVTNEVAFWTAFTKLTGLTQEGFEPTMLEFYNGPYNNIGSELEVATKSIEVLDMLSKKGYPLYLTTTPLFPQVGVANRIKWTGIDANIFQRITTYENSTAAKPSLTYYRENIEIAGVKPEEILMVGNDTGDDLSILELGCDVYLVTDHLINKNGFDIETVKHGDMDAFIEFAKSLPDFE